MKILNLIKIILLSTILLPILMASAGFLDDLKTMGEFQKLKKACENKKDGEACFKAGQIFFGNKDIKADARLKETGALYKKGCEVGHLKSCAELFDLAEVDDATYGWAALKAGDLIEVNNKVLKADWYAAACYFNEIRGCEINCTLGGWSKEKSKEKDYRTDGCMKMVEFAGKKPSNEVIDEQIKWWLKACENGNGEGCANAGLNTKDQNESFKLLSRACDKLNPQACYILGFRAREKGNLRSAEEYYLSSCKDIFYEDSCEILKQIRKEIAEISKGEEAAKNREAAAKMAPILAKLQTACDNGDFNACIQHGLQMVAPADQKNPWFKKTCDGGVMEGCFQMGKGFQALNNFDGAINLFIKACNGGHLQGCLEAGLQSQKINRLADAKKYYLLGCDGGNPNACIMLGNMEQGKGNRGEAAKYYAIACDGGNTTGCNNLASIQIDKSNIAEARKFLNQACDSGSNAACQKLVALAKAKL